MNAAPVIVDYDPFRRRKLEGNRGLQSGMQNVAFEGCVFADNQQRDPPAVFTYGVITVTSEYNSLDLLDCEFTDNVYNQDYGVSKTSDILSMLFRNSFF